MKIQRDIKVRYNLLVIVLYKRVENMNPVEDYMKSNLQFRNLHKNIFKILKKFKNIYKQKILNFKAYKNLNNKNLYKILYAICQTMKMMKIRNNKIIINNKIILKQI